MRRFAFKLEKLLELRSFYEHKAELVLAEKAGRCATLQNRLNEIAQLRARTGREMYESGHSLPDFRAAELYMIRLDKERDKLIEELALAEAEREKARLEYLEKHRDKEAIEKVKERRAAEYYRDALREETKVLDEVGSRQFAGTGR